MTTEVVEYSCKKRITDPEIFKKAKERMDNPNIITGKKGVYYLFEMMGIPIEWDEIFSEK
ncbi:MAG: hypothetical protein IJH65_12645 [Methanobrevibacter sp.]|nr:hypothetical protein [Methanobrevibacter sp.]